MKPSHPARAVALAAVLLVALAPLAQAQSVSPNRYSQNPDNSSSSRPSTWERSREQARAASQQQDQAARLANADRHRQALEDNRRRMENDRQRTERRMAHAAKIGRASCRERVERPMVGEAVIKTSSEGE